MDLSNSIVVITALITAIAAILSPLLVSLINNKHQRKQVKENILFHEKSKIYSEFFSEFGRCSALDTYNNYADFLAVAYKVLLICSESSSEAIKKLIKFPVDTPAEKLLPVFMECADLLCYEIQSAKKYILFDES